MVRKLVFFVVAALLGQALTLGLATAVWADTVVKLAPYQDDNGQPDKSGVMDANRIEAKLREIGKSGGTLFLTDGDPKTRDTYYVSRTIQVPNPHDLRLVGEAMDQTEIRAGRRFEGAGGGFGRVYSEFWTTTKRRWYGADQPDVYASTVLEFDDPTGDMAFADFSIYVEGKSPCDLYPDFYDYDSTYIWTFIELIGVDVAHNTSVDNVRLEGDVGDAFGYDGFNVAWGIHDMVIWEVAAPKKQNLRVHKVIAKNMGDTAVLFMGFHAGSSIDIEDVTATNVAWGILGRGVYGSSVSISHNDITLSSNGGVGIALLNCYSPAKVTHNTIRGSGRYAALYAANASGLEISDNVIEDFVVTGPSFRASIYLWNADGLKLKDNKIEGGSGPAALHFRGGSTNNVVTKLKVKGFSPAMTYIWFDPDATNNTVCVKVKDDSSGLPLFIDAGWPDTNNFVNPPGCGDDHHHKKGKK